MNKQMMKPFIPLALLLVASTADAKSFSSSSSSRSSFSSSSRSTPSYSRSYSTRSTVTVSPVPGIDYSTQPTRRVELVKPPQPVITSPKIVRNTVVINKVTNIVPASRYKTPRPKIYTNRVYRTNTVVHNYPESQEYYTNNYDSGVSEPLSPWAVAGIGAVFISFVGAMGYLIHKGLN